jgi:hypothetical protein
VAHSLSSHFASSYFNATALAYNSLVLDLLVATTRTLPILDRAKDFFTEQAISLGLECAVIDRFWLFDLAMSPTHNVFWASDTDFDFVEETYCGH